MPVNTIPSTGTNNFSLSQPLLPDRVTSGSVRNTSQGDPTRFNTRITDNQITSSLDNLKCLINGTLAIAIANIILGIVTDKVAPEASKVLICSGGIFVMFAAALQYKSHKESIAENKLNDEQAVQNEAAALHERENSASPFNTGISFEISPDSSPRSLVS